MNSSEKRPRYWKYTGNEISLWHCEAALCFFVENWRSRVGWNLRTINEAYCAVQFLARYSPHSPFNCFLLGAGNSSIHVEATLDPLSRSHPYNTHQLALCTLSLSLSLSLPSLIRARCSPSLRGHCSRCGRSIKGLDGNSQLNASPNGCEDLPRRERSATFATSRSRRLRESIEISSAAWYSQRSGARQGETGFRDSERKSGDRVREKRFSCGGSSVGENSGNDVTTIDLCT